MCLVHVLRESNDESKETAGSVHRISSAGKAHAWLASPAEPRSSVLAWFSVTIACLRLPKRAGCRTGICGQGVLALASKHYRQGSLRASMLQELVVCLLVPLPASLIRPVNLVGISAEAHCRPLSATTHRGGLCTHQFSIFSGRVWRFGAERNSSAQSLNPRRPKTLDSRPSSPRC